MKKIADILMKARFENVEEVLNHDYKDGQVTSIIGLPNAGKTSSTIILMHSILQSKKILYQYLSGVHEDGINGSYPEYNASMLKPEDRKWLEDGDPVATTPFHGIQLMTMLAWLDAVIKDKPDFIFIDEPGIKLNTLLDHEKFIHHVKSIIKNTVTKVVMTTHSEAIAVNSHDLIYLRYNRDPVIATRQEKNLDSIVSGKKIWSEDHIRIGSKDLYDRIYINHKSKK